MFLTCPRCNTRYLVDPKTIGTAGRTVKCAACAHSWFQSPAGNEVLQKSPAATPPHEPAIRPIPKGSSLPVPVKKQEAPLAAKAACVALGMAALVALFAVYYSPMLAHASFLRPLYASFGAYDTHDVVLTDIGLTQLPNDANKFIIRGNIHNKSSEARIVPRLRISLVNEAGDVLKSWDSPQVSDMLQPGASMPFATQMLENNFDNAHRFIIDIGNPLELSLRQ